MRGGLREVLLQGAAGAMPGGPCVPLQGAPRWALAMQISGASFLPGSLLLVYCSLALIRPSIYLTLCRDTHPADV